MSDKIFVRKIEERTLKMQYTLNNSNREEDVNLDIRAELLIKALKKEPVELVENQDMDLQLEYLDLLKKQYIFEAKAPFNCRPYRDSHGRLNETKYIKLTEYGKSALKDILFTLKERYKKSA